MKVNKLVVLVFAMLILLSVGSVSLANEPTPTPPPSEDGGFTVHKFHDVNENGMQDPGEEDIEGWLIRIYRWDGTGLNMVASGYTNFAGTVIFEGLAAPTRYKVWEEARVCWQPTTPEGMNYWSHDGHPGYYTVKYTVSNQTTRVQFGNVNICEPPPPPPGTGTPGYWKNHPEAWQVDEITIGGVTYDKADAIDLMDMPVKKDKTFTMFQALVAAKLNVDVGNESSCVDDTIDDADAWMAAYGPVGSGVKGSSDAWQEGEPLYETLDAYNNGDLCAPSRDDLE